MNTFRCVPIPTDTADDFRATDFDDNGNKLRHLVATDDNGLPCRHCLSFARPGEAVLLGSYKLPRPRGICWSPIPIFVHAEACPRFAVPNSIAPIVGRGALVSVRAYDFADQCRYDLGQVCAGADVDTPLARALDDARTAFVNVHTARPGCCCPVSSGSAGARVATVPARGSRGRERSPWLAKVRGCVANAILALAAARREGRDHARLAGMDARSRDDIGRHRVTAELAAFAGTRDRRTGAAWRRLQVKGPRDTR